MSANLMRELRSLCDEIVRVASTGDSGALSDLLQRQQQFAETHRREMDQAAISLLEASLERATRCAKIRRARVLDSIRVNQRSLGVLQAYQASSGTF